MLGAMVAPVTHAVQTLSVGWKESEVWAEWATAAGAVLAAIFAAWAVVREGRLLKTAQEQVQVSQQQFEAMQEQTRIAQAQVEASVRPVLVFLVKGQESWLKNVGSGPALNVRYGEPTQRLKPLPRPVEAAGECPCGPLTIISAQQVNVEYESTDGTNYLTTAQRLPDGAYKHTVRRRDELGAERTPARPPAASSHP